MYEITRQYDFAAAHRIPGHPKCGRMHGHNYVVEVGIGSDTLDSQGMVLDFGRMDEIIKPIIAMMDHHYLATIGECVELPFEDIYRLGGRFSTAECIAQELYGFIKHHLSPNVWVKVWETPKSSALFYSTDERSTTNETKHLQTNKQS